MNIQYNIAPPKAQLIAEPQGLLQWLILRRLLRQLVVSP